MRLHGVDRVAEQRGEVIEERGGEVADRVELLQRHRLEHRLEPLGELAELQPEGAHLCHTKVWSTSVWGRLRDDGAHRLLR